MVIRHNHLRDVVVELCHSAHWSVDVEKGHSHTRDHNYARPDITVASPLTPAILGESSKLAGAAALAAETCKLLSNEPKCQELGVDLHPYDSGNLWESGQRGPLKMHLAVGLSSQKHQSWMIYTAG